MMYCKLNCQTEMNGLRYPITLLFPKGTTTLYMGTSFEHQVGLIYCVYLFYELMCIVFIFYELIYISGEQVMTWETT